MALITVYAVIIGVLENANIMARRQKQDQRQQPSESEPRGPRGLALS